MGSMSRDNDAKAKAVGAAIESALKAIGLDADTEVFDVGHQIGVRIGCNGRYYASRLKLPSVADENNISAVLPGWEPPTNG